MEQTISLLNWYHNNKRPLPWRESRNPYFIWLSEVILQQTRVEQGLPYYLKFIEQYPTVTHLAKAPIDDVLRLWQGLGYYSRAKNLHETALQVVSKYNGNFPYQFSHLIELKGIGDYTASAISSIVSGEKQAVVDGNVFRVLSRYYGIDTPIQSNQAKKQFKALANDLLTENHDAGLINQGLMELGSQICTPKNPKCHDCPWQNACFAFEHNKQGDFPVKLAKKASKTVYLHYFILQHENKILLSKRDQTSIWKGLYQPLLIESQLQSESLPIEKLAEMLHTKPNQLKVQQLSEPVTHLLTHRKLIVSFYTVETQLKKINPPLGYQFFDHHLVSTLPFPIVIARFMEKHFQY